MNHSAGSDGLWDNAFESEILQLLPKNADDVQRTADSVATLARQHAADGDFPSPYTREALSQGCAHCDEVLSLNRLRACDGHLSMLWHGLLSCPSPALVCGMIVRPFGSGVRERALAGRQAVGGRMCGCGLCCEV